ncbi:UPF0262 family protein [Devosia ginsengisoli]|uniref:Uncharacterized protein n=1 Tax=Devosia ginsengisoli TaxID=400770 RepID=A0A5B8LMG3_9HYPH|nr:hypothetical protein FPZ08_00075 [Devosia ginsengisoli]
MNDASPSPTFGGQFLPPHARVKRPRPLCVAYVIGNSIVLDVRRGNELPAHRRAFLAHPPPADATISRIRDAYYEYPSNPALDQTRNVDIGPARHAQRAAALLRTRLTRTVIIDLSTARRLFTP